MARSPQRYTSRGTPFYTAADGTVQLGTGPGESYTRGDGGRVTYEGGKTYYTPPGGGGRVRTDFGPRWWSPPGETDAQRKARYYAQPEWKRRGLLSDPNAGRGGGGAPVGSGGGGAPTGGGGLTGGGSLGMRHSVDLSDPFDPRLQAVDISGTQPNLPTLGSKGGGGKGGEPKQPPSTGGTNKLSGGKGGRTTQPPSTDMGAALRAPFAQSVYDRSMFLLRPELDREQARIDANIANRGLAPTSQAARGLQGMFADQRSRRLNDLATGATLAGSQEQQRLANLYLAADAQRFGQGFANQQQRLAELTARAQQQLALRGLQQQGTGMRAQQQLGLGGLNLQTGAQQFGQQMALRNQQIQEALMRRQQPIQDLGGLLAATQGLPTMPQFTQTALAAPDYMGLLGSVYGARASRPSGKGGMLGGLGGLLTGASQAAGLFSDRKTKENIRRIGTADNSLPIYAFNYKGDGRTMLGFMADEVEKVHPEAVGEIAGLKTVNYALATRPVT